MVRGLLRPWMLCAIGCVLLAGCKESGPPVKMVTGRVVENSQPVPIKDYRLGYNYIEVQFVPIDDAGKPTGAGFIAAAAADGSFKVGGEKGEGIPPKKYRVALRHIDRTATGKPDPSGKPDAWKGKYDGDKAPVTVDTSTQQDVTIDLAKLSGEAPAKGESSAPVKP